jgi:hypothetical protein
MLSFSEFVNSFPTNAAVKGNAAAQRVYENIICREDVRIKFADASDVNVPALSACVNEIEDYCSVNDTLDLSDRRVRQAIGRMVAASLEPLGYVPARRTRMPQNVNSRFFSSTYIYEYKGNESQRIERRIIDIAANERSVENENLQ